MNFAKGVRFVVGLLSLWAGTAAAQGRAQVDSIAVQRFIAARPNHVPLTKRRVLSAGSSSMSSTLQALSDFGLDSMTSDSTDVPSLCRGRWADSSGMWITVFSGSNGRRIVVPDDCPTETADGAARVEALRAFAWDILRNRR